MHSLEIQLCHTANENRQPHVSYVNGSKLLENSLFSNVVALLIFPLETWLRDGTN